MGSRDRHLDCCGSPRTTRVKTIYSSAHDAEALLQCESCGRYWFYRFHEFVDFSGGDDDITDWYSPLTDEEAAAIISAAERPNLAFLTTRPSLMIDGEGVQRVAGQPDEPWT